MSEPLTNTHDVPQGSILGPTLFNLHMNDLPDVIKFSNIESYVDGTTIYFSFASTNEDRTQSLAIDIGYLEKYMSQETVTGAGNLGQIEEENGNAPAEDGGTP